MKRTFYALATLILPLSVSCSSNSQTADGQTIFSALPDTVKPTGDYDGYFDADGVFAEGGPADYLINKPYNPAGFVFVGDGIRWHIKVSEEYQNQMHKYASLEVFKSDSENRRRLYLAINECKASNSNKLEICDCTGLKVK